MTTWAWSPIASALFFASGDHVLVAAAETVEAAEVKDIISWDKTVHDFGDVSVKDGPLSCTFTVTNNGTEPVTIFEVVSSCGCTDVKWSREKIQPGKTGTVSATYKNEDGPMPFDKTLTVYISGVKKPVILRLRGVVHEKKKSLAELYGAQKLGTFGMKTREFQAGTVRQGLSVSETAQVANLGKAPLKVSFADVSDHLSVSVSPNPIPAGKVATLSMTVQSAPGVYGRQTYRATPVLDGKKASAPRGDGQVELIDVFHDGDEALDHGCGRLAVHGNGTGGSEDGTYGPEEEFLLYHAVGYLPELGIKEVADDEVPYRGMRDTQDDGFGFFHGVIS